MTRDRKAGLVLVAVSLVYGALALRLPSHAGDGPGPAALPLLLAGSLLLLGLAMATDGVRAAGQDPPGASRSPGPSAPTRTARHPPRWLLVAVLLVAYVPAFGYLGFPLSTSVLVLLIAWVQGERRALALTLLPVVVPYLLYLLFSEGLGVTLPMRPDLP